MAGRQAVKTGKSEMVFYIKLYLDENYMYCDSCLICVDKKKFCIGCHGFCVYKLSPTNISGVGRGIAMEMSGALTKVLIGKKGREMKTKQAAGENSSGFTNEQSPKGGAFSGDLLEKSQSPRFSPRVGGWGRGLVTND